MDITFTIMALSALFYGFLIGCALCEYWFMLQEMSTIRFFPKVPYEDLLDNEDTDVDDA